MLHVTPPTLRYRLFFRVKACWKRRADANLGIPWISVSWSSCRYIEGSAQFKCQNRYRIECKTWSGLDLFWGRIFLHLFNKNPTCRSQAIKAAKKMECLQSLTYRSSLFRLNPSFLLVTSPFMSVDFSTWVTWLSVSCKSLPINIKPGWKNPKRLFNWGGAI